MKKNILVIDPAYTKYNQGPRLAGPLIAGEILKYPNLYDVNLSAFLDFKKEDLSWEEFRRLEQRFILKTLDLARDSDVILSTDYSDTSKRTSFILKQIKQKYPKKKIIRGGYHIKTIYQQGNSNFLFDSYPFTDLFSTAQQGTFHIKEILEGLLQNKSLEQIPGIIYKKDGRIIDNKINTETIKEMMNHFGTIKGYEKYKELGLDPEWLIIASCQGCPWNCYFCPDKNSRFTRRDLSEFKSELKLLKLIFPNLKQIRLSDPDSTALSNSRSDRLQMFNLFNAIKEVGFYWSAFVRSDEVNDEILKVMYDSGCRSILAGIEVADVKNRYLIKGGNFLNNKSKDFILLCKKNRIVPRISLLLGGVGENYNTIFETVKYACEATKNGAEVGIHILEPQINKKLKVLELAKRYHYNWSIDDFDFNIPDHLYPFWVKKCSKTVFPALEIHATESIINESFRKFPEFAKELNLNWTKEIPRSAVASIADLSRKLILNLGGTDPGRASLTDVIQTKKAIEKESNLLKE